MASQLTLSRGPYTIAWSSEPNHRDGSPAGEMPVHTEHKHPAPLCPPVPPSPVTGVRGDLSGSQTILLKNDDTHCKKAENCVCSAAEWLPRAFGHESPLPSLAGPGMAVLQNVPGLSRKPQHAAVPACTTLVPQSDDHFDDEHPGAGSGLCGQKSVYVPWLSQNPGCVFLKDVLPSCAFPIILSSHFSSRRSVSNLHFCQFLSIFRLKFLKQCYF